MCQNVTQSLQLYSGIQKYNLNLKLAALYHVHIHEHYMYRNISPLY